MRIRTSVNTSLTKTGKVRVTTRTKMPMLPAMHTSTTLATSPPTKRRRRKRR